MSDRHFGKGIIGDWWECWTLAQLTWHGCKNVFRIPRGQQQKQSLFRNKPYSCDLMAGNARIEVKFRKSMFNVYARNNCDFFVAITFDEVFQPIPYVIPAYHLPRQKNYPWILLVHLDKRGTYSEFRNRWDLIVKASKTII